jgi:hypothetical protein
VKELETVEIGVANSLLAWLLLDTVAVALTNVTSCRVGYCAWHEKVAVVAPGEKVNPQTEPNSDPSGTVIVSPLAVAVVDEQRCVPQTQMLSRFDVPPNFR